jgi:acid phosphatase (class A)
MNKWVAVAFSGLMCTIISAVSAQTFVDAERNGLIETVGEPPTLGTLAHDADLQGVLIAQMQRSDAEAYAAKLDGELSAHQWAQATLGKGYSSQTHPASFALFDEVRANITKVVDVLKAKGPQRRRPHQDHASVKPSLRLDEHNTNGWPSGRAAASRVWAGVLSDLFPERAAALTLAAERSAALRVTGGVHYPTDLVAGKKLADAFLVILRANPTYRTKLASAKLQDRKNRLNVNSR